MAKSLDEIYAEDYLGHKSPNADLIVEDTDTDTDADDSAETTPKKSFKPFKKSKKGKGKLNVGADLYNDSVNNTFDSLYSTFMEQFDEDGGELGFDDTNDDTFDFEDDDMGDGDEESFTLSELRSMTLGELCDLLNGSDEDEYEDEFESEDGFDDMDEGDDIPRESYGQTGGGAHHGNQGNYDGKAKRQPTTSHVKGNGDADFGRQDTGYDPEDTEGSEGAEHGNQGNYDGKAKRQPATSHVKANGDANFGKQNTGYRTRSGKKDKNYF